LIYEYFGIDLEAVWDILRKDIPAFKENILKVFRAEKGNND